MVTAPARRAPSVVASRSGSFRRRCEISTKVSRKWLFAGSVPPCRRNPPLLARTEVVSAVTETKSCVALLTPGTVIAPSRAPGVALTVVKSVALVTVIKNVRL